MRQPIDPNPSPYERVMARRRRDWRLHLIGALIVVIVAVAVGVYRRESGGTPLRDFTLNAPSATR